MALQVGEEVPAEDLPESTTSTEVPDSDLPEVPEHDMPDSEESPDLGAYSGGMQQAVAGLEGVAKGVAGPLATMAEVGLGKMGVPGLAPEDISGRAEANPWTHGIGEGVGLVGGAMVPGLGEYSLGSKIGQFGKATGAAAKALEIGKVGQTALKLATEGGLFHLTDNVSKMILGETDPEAPVASLLAGVPAATLLGGGLGYVGGKAANKLQEIANSKSANKVSQWLADLGSRFDVLSKHGGMEGTTEAAADQAQHLHDTVAAAVDDGFSLKRKSIEKLTEDLNPDTVRSFANNTLAKLSNAPRSMQGSELFQDALQEWKSRVFPSTDMVGGQSMPSPADVFEATDSLKKKLQYWAKFEKRVSDPNQLPFVQGSKNISNFLRTALEDSEHWGEMGNFQKKLNSAYSEILTPLSDFTKSATQKLNGEAAVDKGKLFSIFRQLGKGKQSAEIRSDKISNFFDPAKKFLETVHNLHADQGIESSLPSVSTDILDEMLNKELPAGAKAATWLFDNGQTAVGMAGSHAVGTAVGAVAGHPYLGYRAGEALFPILKEMGKKPTRWAVSALLRSLAAGEYQGIPDAINYAEKIHKGAESLEKHLDNLFIVGGKQHMSGDASEIMRDQLKKHIADGTMNQQINNQKNEGSQKPVIREEPTFAHGGEVLAHKPVLPTQKKVKPLISKSDDHVSTVFPEQSMLLSAAKGRINNYLNQIRPQEVKNKLPFDEASHDKSHERDYHKAIDLANNPLKVIDHIKNGTLEPDQVKHMNGMYPELSNHLRKKITERITESQMKNEPPPYKVRQSLSMFMGSALDSNLTPQNIQAAQATFAMQKAQQQPQKNTDKLSQSDDRHRTIEQSAVERQNRVKN